MFYIPNFSNRLFNGQTNIPAIRFRQHPAGKVRYAKAHHPWVLIYHAACPTWRAAPRHEREFKSPGGRDWTKSKGGFAIDSKVVYLFAPAFLALTC